MHLRALRLNGFKSFAEPTTLRFERGVTAVVGPNGCGKSNIADAIRWALGEQSAKALRGGQMQDVIFEGSDKRKALPICEVSLILTECEEALGVGFHEVEITRRVSRDGSSDYFLNGRACRLKDIQKLFMDTGVGRTSYSIMAQGQIDQILSSKPEERRAVFEEAAGITKYKSQRREALNKLNLVDQNLSRVTDVIGEVARQIGSLRRQAAKAVRYKKLSHRLRHLDLAQAASLHAELSAVVTDLEARSATVGAEAEKLSVEVAEQETELQEKRGRRHALNQKVQESQQSVFDLRSKREGAENQARLAEVRRKGLEERINSARDELGSIEVQIREIAAKVDSGAQDKQQYLDILGTSDETFQIANSELAAIEAQLSAADADLQKTKYRQLEDESALVRFRNDRANLEVEEKTREDRRRRLDADLVEQQGHQQTARTHLEEIRSQAEASRQRQAEEQERLATAQAQSADLSRQFKDVQRRIQEADRALAQKSARFKLLQQLQEKFEGFGEGAKALLQGKLEGALAGQRFHPLAENLRIRKGYAKALEALLGSAVEAVSVTNLEVATDAIAQLSARKVGRACLKFPAPGGTVSSDPAGKLPEFLRPAASIVTFTRPGSGEAHPVEALLAGCFVAESAADFLAYWSQQPDFAFSLVATVEGELIDRRGLIAGGHRKGEGNSILEREADLRETAEAIEQEQKALTAIRSEAEAINRSLADADAAVEEGRRAILEITRFTSSLQAEERGADRAVQEVVVRCDRLKREIGEIDDSQARDRERLVRAQKQHEEAEARLEAVRQKLAELDGRIGALRHERDLKRELVTQARFDLAEKRQRVETLSRGISEMEQRRLTLARLQTSREQEIRAWAEQIEAVGREIARAEAETQQLEAAIGPARELVEASRSTLTQLEAAIDQLERAASASRMRSESVRGDHNKLNIRLAEEGARLRFLVEEVTREHQVEPNSINWKRELWLSTQQPEGARPLDLEDDEDGGNGRNGKEAEPTAGPARAEPTEAELEALSAPDWVAIRAEVQALRQRLAGLGPVNLVAIEEYVELKQRHEFLQTQVNDLTRSKEELLKAIDDINRTSQQQFADTFAQIRKNFAATFSTLFGGGVADLELVETDDVLESGIEIVAQPPGTKLKKVSLLSGGQRTMTAVGLLFAIYLVKPSPFCLLDELDAPLDESNIGRFTGLLKQFTDRSQFIIITHNKRTVAAAQAIYGVTMEEKGVSKVVSMRFNSEHGDAEPVKLELAEANA
jgi:chromosome segregation protein